MRQDGNLPKRLEIPINDEHYYEPREYFMKSRQYDSYPRDRMSKVYLGEYASKDKKLIDALAEALYLLHVERNGGVVVMTSYAPLLARKNATNWNPDLIYFDNERVYPTCSYYVQQMFGQSQGDYYYGDCVEVENPDKSEGDGFLQEQSVILNTKDRKALRESLQRYRQGENRKNRPFPIQYQEECEDDRAEG